MFEVSIKNSANGKLEICMYDIILPTSLQKSKLFVNNGQVAKENKTFKHYQIHC